MIDFADLDTDPMLSPAYPAVVMREDAIRKAAHIINGGEADAYPCQRCAGTGRWRGHTRTFPCMGCNGTGKTTKAKFAAAKGKATKAANLAARRAVFEAEHAELMGSLRAIAGWHNFAREMVPACCM